MPWPALATICQHSHSSAAAMMLETIHAGGAMLHGISDVTAAFVRQHDTSQQMEVLLVLWGHARS